MYSYVQTDINFIHSYHCHWMEYHTKIRESCYKKFGLYLCRGNIGITNSTSNSLTTFYKFFYHEMINIWDGLKVAWSPAAWSPAACLVTRNIRCSSNLLSHAPRLPDHACRASSTTHLACGSSSQTGAHVHRDNRATVQTHNINAPNVMWNELAA
jgi:hypothetical protein